MIHINSDGGRIGRIWWFNSNPIPHRFTFPHAGFMVTMELQQWGTFGFGGQVTIDWQPRSYDPACGTGGVLLQNPPWAGGEG